MKNLEFVELLKKYKRAIKSGIIRLDDLCNCNDCESELYKKVDIESIMDLFDYLFEFNPMDLENFFNLIFNCLSLDEIRKNEDNLHLYSEFLSAISNINKDNYEELKGVFDIWDNQKSKNSEYRHIHIKSLKEILESSDDIKLKQAKIEFLNFYLNLNFSCDDEFCYANHHLDDIKTVVFAKNSESVEAFLTFLEQFNKNNYADNAYRTIRYNIFNADPERCLQLVEVALNKNIIKYDYVVLAITCCNNYPFPLMFNAIVDELLLSSNNYVSTLFSLGTALKNDNKFRPLCSVAVNSYSILSDSRFSDMNLICTSDNSHIIYTLSQIASSKDSLDSDYHDDDMKMIKSLDKETLSDSDLWKIFNLKEIATSKESLESSHHIEDMNFVYSLQLPNDCDLSDFDFSRIATDSRSLSSLYHRYNMEFMAKNGYKMFAPLYTDSNSLNSKYHQYNLETLLKYSHLDICDRKKLISVLTDKESLESDLHMLNVSRFLSDIESRYSEIDGIIDELLLEPDSEFSEPEKILQKVRVTDKKY